MSQIKLKGIHISELDLEINKIKKDVEQSAKKVTNLEKNVEDLKTEIDDIKYKLRGKLPLVGAKHIIWDFIIEMSRIVIPYLNMMEDKTTLFKKALHKCVVANETMTKRTSETAQNAINFLNSTNNEQLRALGVKDRINVMLWARKIIYKHIHINNVKNKAKDMRNSL